MKKVWALASFAAASLVLTLPGAAPASAAVGVCTGVHSGETFANGLIVPDGERCTINSQSTVVGNVVVGHGSAFGAFDSSITGNLYAEDATVQLRGTSVGNNLTSVRPRNFPLSETSFLLKLVVCASSVGGTLMVADAVDGGPMAIGGGPCVSAGGGSNTIGGSLVYRNNSASSHSISDNRAATMVCSGNTPAPTGSGNTARLKTGQCSSL